MFSPMRCGARLPITVVGLALATCLVAGPPALARGGHGGGGHGGGGHGGGHHGGGHHGGYHHGGYHHGGYYHGGNGYYYGGTGYYGGYYPGSYYGTGYYGSGGYGYGYGYGSNNTYPTYVYSDPSYVQGSPAIGASVGYAGAGQGRYLGIDEQAVADAAGSGMKVLQVYPESPAAQAGLQPGDIILSANGYVMQQHGNLAWVISSLPPGGALQMNVRKFSDGAVHAVSVNVP